MTIKKEMFNELITDYRNPGDLLGENGSRKQLTKQLSERVRQAESTQQLGYGKNQAAPVEPSKQRNGTTAEKVKSAVG